MIKINSVVVCVAGLQRVVVSCDTGLTGKYWHCGSSVGLHTEYLNVVHWCAAAPAEKIFLRQFKST